MSVITRTKIWQASIRTALLCACASIGACAQGGGDEPDSGIRLFDSGPPRDGGMPMMDSGQPEEDSGTPPRSDAGPPRVDAGRDAGPPGMDAGPRDAGPMMCTESPCRLVSPQCGCAAGQACYLTGSGRACETVGSRGEGSACSSYTDCASGMACAGGVCSRYCNTHSDCPGRGSYCVFDIGGANVCSTPCEPADNGGCPSGFSCRWNDAGPFYYTDCEPAGAGGPGDVCSSSDDCGPALTCVDILGDSACEQACRLDGADCSLCQAFLDGTPSIDGDDYGFCLIP